MAWLNSHGDGSKKPSPFFMSRQNTKLKKLNDHSPQALRVAMEYMLQYEFNKWICPRRMRAYMWGLSARPTEAQIRYIMEDIFQENVENPQKTYIKGPKGLCYKCIAYRLS